MDEQKRIFSMNLDRLIKLSGKTQAEIAKDINVSPAAMNMWCKGVNFPRMPKIQKLAKYFRVTVRDLVDPHEEDFKRVPVLGRVTAGIPIEAIEEVIDYEEVDSRIAEIKDLFGLRIKGDSMSPQICDGDTVIVHKQEDAEVGATVIATINGDDAVCKRLYRYGHTVLLRSNNPAYDDIDVTGREDFHIVGVVMELRRKF